MGSWHGSSPPYISHRFPLFIIPRLSYGDYPITSLPRFSHQNQFLPVSEVSCIKMFPNNAAAAKRLGKRKVREVGEETAAAAFNLQSLHLASSSVAPVDGRASQSQVQNILNNAAAAAAMPSTKKPFSYMALLMADDDDDIEDEYRCCPSFKDIKDQTDQINQMILFHNESLRRSVVEMFEKQNRSPHCEEEERAKKRLKAQLQERTEQNAQLERMVAHYRGEAERLMGKVRHLERTAMSLSEGLQQANATRFAEAVEEEAESSFEDPDRVGPVRLECKVCERQLATMMMWPCRHICVCTGCDDATKRCPVCRLVKTTSVEVYLPLD